MRFSYDAAHDLVTSFSSTIGYEPLRRRIGGYRFDTVLQQLSMLYKLYSALTIMRMVQTGFDTKGSPGVRDS